MKHALHWILDEGSGIRGGRPEIIYFRRNLLDVGKGFSKSSNTTTMITGSSAVGEAILPHFQFTTAAQSDETKRLQCDIQSFMPKVRGKFGCEEEKMWSMTYGMNAKGGMDEEEFDKYVFGSLIPLYPDAEDTPGKRVMLKVDSGPGRMNVEVSWQGCASWGFI